MDDSCIQEILVKIKAIVSFRVRAKSLWCLRCRLASKFLAFTLAFLIHLFLDYKEPASIKHLLFL